tara:strand:- start:1669 stop:1893 length:225 start_codon:yes stop_codon:yes gene_type:complete
MEVDLTDLLNSYEVVPVSLSDPFKSLVLEPSTVGLLKILPVIAFIALLILAVWRQSKKIPLTIVSDSSENNKNE